MCTKCWPLNLSIHSISLHDSSVITLAAPALIINKDGRTSAKGCIQAILSLEAYHPKCKKPVYAMICFSFLCIVMSWRLYRTNLLLFSVIHDEIMFFYMMYFIPHLMEQSLHLMFGFLESLQKKLSHINVSPLLLSCPILYNLLCPRFVPRPQWQNLESRAQGLGRWKHQQCPHRSCSIRSDPKDNILEKVSNFLYKFSLSLTTRVGYMMH